MYVLENSQVKYCKILAQYYFLWNVIYELVTNHTFSSSLNWYAYGSSLSASLLQFSHGRYVRTAYLYVFIDIRMSGVMFLTCVSGVRMSGVVFLSNYYIIIYNDIWWHPVMLAVPQWHPVIFGFHQLASLLSPVSSASSVTAWVLYAAQPKHNR
jgi:hypothetical protein